MISSINYAAIVNNFTKRVNIAQARCNDSAYHKHEFNALCLDLKFIQDCRLYTIRLCNSAIYTVDVSLQYMYAITEAHVKELIIERDQYGTDIYHGSFNFTANDLIFGYMRKGIDTDPGACFARLGIQDPLTYVKMYLQQFQYDIRVAVSPFPEKHCTIYLCFPQYLDI